jgi:peptidyl-prolyl cis-trans isomerase C
MQQPSGGILFGALLLSITSLLLACSDEKPREKSLTKPDQVATRQLAQPDVIARVGEEVITFSQLDSLVNSSAMVGLSIPDRGTRERHQLMMTLLDKIITANLLYLDAKQRGLDRLASYTEDVNRFEDAVIASLYKAKVLLADSKVSEAEVLHYYNTQTSKEAELNDDTRLAIESIIRKQRMEELEATLHDRLMADIDVVINDRVLSSDYDAKRSDADIVATFNTHRINWSQVKDMMRGADPGAGPAAFYIGDDEERRKRLEQFIDNAIMTLKGREAGFENDPVYIQRSDDYRKTRLINEHRNGLIHSWNPSDHELQAYLNANREKIVIPEKRRIQMVVVATEEEAQSIKQQIDENDMTIYQAALLYSIDPDAVRTLGDIGWVSQGSGYPELDAFAFSLPPGVLAGPVESPAGWHLVKVLDVIAARFENLNDPQTRDRTFKAYMQVKMDNYVADLSKNHFTVAVYSDVLERYLQQEADAIAEHSQPAEQEPPASARRIEEMQQWLMTLPAE